MKETLNEIMDEGFRSDDLEAIKYKQYPTVEYKGEIGAPGTYNP